MTRLTIPQVRFGGIDALRPLTVAEYHQMIRAGILHEGERVELLEGYLVRKMTRLPPHDTSIQLVEGAIDALLPAGWTRRTQCAITLSDSEPEPDLVIARGNRRTYSTSHPGPGDLGLVVEVADSSLQSDRADKGRIYARAGIAVYWIVNLVDHQIEVYSDPSGPGLAPSYATTQIYRPGMTLSLILGGVHVGSVAASDLLP